MKVTVVGKEHKEGISKKTGNPYNSNLVHVTYPISGVEGQMVDTVWLDAVSYPLRSIEIGADYNYESFRGRVVAFTKL